MALVLTDLEKVSLSVAFTSAAGNPAVVDGVPVWGTSDESILSVVAAEDGLSAVVTTVGPIGTAQVSVTADADLGEGIKPLVGTLDVSVVASEAVFAIVASGAPEPK